MEIKFMELAIQLANDNVHSKGGGPFGAVIVKDGIMLPPQMTPLHMRRFKQFVMLAKI